MSVLVFGNLFVALCAASLVLATWADLEVLGQGRVLDPMVGLVFFATLMIYNLDRVAPTSPEDEGSARRAWIEQRRGALLGLGGVGALGALGCGVALGWELFWALVPLGAITIAYIVPILPGPGRWRRLKDLPGVKIFVIALVWALATAALPAWRRGFDPWAPRVLWLSAERALFIFTITLPFDVRDLGRDQAAGVITLPHLLGLVGTRRLALAGCAGVGASAMLRHGLAQAGSLGWPMLASMALTAGLLGRMSPEQPERYYAVYMEGMMLAQSALVVGWTLAG